MAKDYFQNAVKRKSYLYIEQLSVEYRDEHNFVKNLNVNMFLYCYKNKNLTTIWNFKNLRV